ncbi:hypothetical protein PUNSTDRAFT_43946 [Punctularia strigosozonata HHB-11173 SS5]|uniref:uncharacterized protein n=1 Tax=Punctularia strigosozonata (strain HHB-11173) TaxID=741275 RepID=UPI0004416C16|nr:uncharacterized protein PUNSTDRAFT_43946 [Punctularia strigosozonata HHB-11173 SS5]EIN09617.1 hypothetical protein PUNSTDRAFT_43946 [Punctularia strigosozonata HHB-11173 SS5]
MCQWENVPGSRDEQSLINHYTLPPMPHYKTQRAGYYVPAPQVEVAEMALADLDEVIHPSRPKGHAGHHQFEGDDLTWCLPLLEKGDLSSKIHDHPLGLGNNVRAANVMSFINTPEIQGKYGITKGISLSTTKNWMHMMEYRWKKTPSGQYVDGHEQDDVVHYRQSQFLPAYGELELNMQSWNDGIEEIEDDHQRVQLRHVMIHWVHESETAKPKPNGKGASIMVSDFISTDYGWLQSPGGDRSPMYDSKTGKVVKEKAQMMDVRLPDGSPQHLYFSDETFKGMAILLKERGFHDADKIRAECPGFQCPNDNQQCCCRCLLFTQPDFIHVDCLLESICKTQGYHVLFLPKFHPELNFIEIC